MEVMLEVTALPEVPAGLDLDPAVVPDESTDSFAAPETMEDAATVVVRSNAELPLAEVLERLRLAGAAFPG